MSGLWWLILGLLAGWLIELAVDYRYWRRQALIAALRLAEREAALTARSQSLDEKQGALNLRDEELSGLQVTLAAKDAELLAQAKRIDERAEEITRLEQAMDKRRADLDRMGLTLNEREKDIGARNDTLKVAEADVAARLQKLEPAEVDVSRRVAVVSNRESAMQNWEARILAREHEVGDKEADLVRQAATATALSASLAAMKDLVHRQYQTAEGDDDLQAIEGIGPKIANLLRNAGIRTFERLSETSLGELTRTLEAGGSRFGLADPLSWAEQAACLVNGDYVAFERLKEELIGGVRRDAALLQQAADAAEAAQNPSGDGAGNESKESKESKESDDGKDVGASREDDAAPDGGASAPGHTAGREAAGVVPDTVAKTDRH